MIFFQSCWIAGGECLHTASWCYGTVVGKRLGFTADPCSHPGSHAYQKPGLLQVTWGSQLQKKAMLMLPYLSFIFPISIR